MGIPPTIEAANLGMADSLLLMVLALVVFGPRRLPQIGKQLGKLMYEFRKASNDFKFQMEEELRNAEEADRRIKEEAERLRQLALAPAAETTVAAAETAVALAETPAETESPNQSPYPYESTYPEVAAPDAPAEGIYPRIDSATTDEPVSEERAADLTGERAVAEETGPAANLEAGSAIEPAGPTANLEAGSEAGAEAGPESSAAPAAVAEEIPVEKEAAVKEETPVAEANALTEPAAHNG
jgi:sec-independent protein translocase protein TatB